MQRMRVIQAFVKRGGAENGGADAFQRTGADETGRLPDEIGILFSAAEGARPRRAQHKAGFRLFGCAEIKAEAGKALLLSLKSLAAAVRTVCAAEEHLPVLMDGPGAAVGRLRIEDTGVKRIDARRIFAEPLLNGHIGARAQRGKQTAPHQ